MSHWFNSAKEFLVQNGMFVDQSVVKKIYIKKVYSSSENGPVGNGIKGNDRLDSADARLSDYKRFLRGDVMLLESVQRYDREKFEEKGSTEYIAEIAGENKRSVARVYEGPGAHARLRMELEFLSKAWHPRIYQVFGIFESTDHTGLLFYDDGVRRDVAEYALSLTGSQRALFFFKYVLEYNDTLRYLDNSVIYGTLEITSRDSLHVVIRTHINQHVDHFCTVDFYINSYGDPRAVLSINPATAYRNWHALHGSILNGIRRVFPQNPSGLCSNELKLLQSLFDDEVPRLQPRHRIRELISKWHRVLLSVKQLAYIPGVPQDSVYINRPVAIWMKSTSGRTSEFLSRGWAALSLDISGHFRVNHKLYSSMNWEPGFLFYENTARVGKFTRVVLNQDRIKRMDSHYVVCYLSGYCTVSENDYIAWLAQVLGIREQLGVTGDSEKRMDLNVGLVSRVGVSIHIDITLLLVKQFLKCHPTMEIYLFVSDPPVNDTDGKVSNPSYYWSLDRQGKVPLSEFSAAMKGLSVEKISLAHQATFWDSFYYEAHRDFYKACGVNPTEVSSLLGLPEFVLEKQRQLNTPILDAEHAGIDYYQTEHLLYLSEYPLHDWKKANWGRLSSLSWIGVTALEDYRSVRFTVYESKNSRESYRQVEEAQIQKSAREQLEEELEGWTDLASDTDSIFGST